MRVLRRIGRAWTSLVAMVGRKRARVGMSLRDYDEQWRKAYPDDTSLARLADTEHPLLRHLGRKAVSDNAE